MTNAEQARKERQKQAEQRKADSIKRRQRSNRRQRAADMETYGEGSMSFEAQEGNIYDVETGEYDPTFNKEGTDERISNDGVDQFGLDDDPEDASTTVVDADWYNYEGDGGNLIIGADPAKGTIDSIQVTYSGLSFKCQDAGGGFNIMDNSGNAKINVFMQDAPTATDNDPAKFREVKVCNNGKAATMYVLGTKPKNS